MRASTIIKRGAAWMIIAMLAMPPVIPAQDYGQAELPDSFKKEELTQMLAPIALYPDSLIAQMLVASTYPLEVVEAERWVRQNKDLKGDALNDALQEKTWDPSVKSLCHFPDVLFAMSDKLDQTRKLGDAFLSQEDEVMATIQELRKKAEEQGSLKTTREQQVIVEKEVIKIVPADPEVVFVPVYDPFYVYGPWWYPAYPPYYWYYPPGFVTGGFIGFRHRVFIGVSIFPWIWFDWHFHRVHIDIHKTSRFHRFDHRRDYDRPFWEHNPSHRKGVAYRDRTTSQRFRFSPAPASPVPPPRPEMRGFPDRDNERDDVRQFQRPDERRGRTITPQERRGPSGAQGTDERRGRIAVPQERRGPSDLERRGRTGAPSVRPERERGRGPVRETPFRGIGEGNFERKASERGGASRQRGGEIRRGKDMSPQDKGQERKGGDKDRPGRGDTKGGGSSGSGKGG
ncbi:MAG: DUF3300 domain-containing protein [Nitrospirae bacterium]|nr:DUF3300 domain-containing protein [Nitrospirota bacterium]